MSRTANRIKEAQAQMNSRPGGVSNSTPKPVQADKLQLSGLDFVDPRTLQESDQNPFNHLDDEKFARFKKDIEQDGILVPVIARLDGIVIDGHNRLRAAKELNLPTIPVFRVENDITPEDATRVAKRLQLHRRNIDPVEQAMLLSELYPGALETKRGGIGHDDLLVPKTVAKELGVSESTVKRAKRLHREAESVAEGVTPTKEHYKRAKEKLKVKKERKAFDVGKHLVKIYKAYEAETKENKKLIKDALQKFIKTL